MKNLQCSAVLLLCILIYNKCVGLRNFTTRPVASLVIRPNAHQPNHRILMPHIGSNHDGLIQGKAINTEPFYLEWPEPRRIYFDLDSSYTQNERVNIIQAMGQISADTKGCVRFVPYNPSNQTDFISITPLEDAGSMRYGCWSFPGRVFNQNGRGQLLGLTRGPAGCINNQRELMKTLVHVLGFRMVPNRPDRDAYITINYENMAREWRSIDPYRKYSESQVIYRSLPFDFNSITFHVPTKFSRDGTSPVYTINDNSKTAGAQPRLSFWDCVGISAIYKCNPNFCPDAYGDMDPNQLPTNRPPITGGGTTQPTPPTRPTRPTVPDIPTPPTQPTIPTFPTPPQPDTTRPTRPTPPDSGTTPTSPDFPDPEEFTLPTTTEEPETTTEDPNAITTPFTFVTFTRPSRTRPPPRPITTASTTNVNPPINPPFPNNLNIPTINPTTNSVLTAICRPTFRVDAAVFSENGKIYLFSGDRFWTMDIRGDVIDAGINILDSFDGRVQPPIQAAWSDGKQTTLVDASRKEIIVRNERFISINPSLFPKIQSLTEAFLYNFTTGPAVYYITNDGTEIQIGADGPSKKFAEVAMIGLGPKIDAAFTVPMLASQMIGLFSGNDFAYVVPCTMNIAQDPSPCFQSLPVGTWPVPFSNMVSFPQGNCRRRIRLRFPHFRQL
ncbi:uncharacterized protein LOC129596160 [Paramacrobiotus metropolitanus]|uniref:uncharacterized protein LOC129596160 n=1 Tax=Paramacrobiotus metropolitanus TaxID=2943436 RepID=UPI0024464AF8|nr:uncharacterized protein LOC129596160 [Paramacrobiotus metropolitanus]